MDCSPATIACQIALLRADLQGSWLETALTVFVWPFLAVLIPVLVAIFVTRHARKSTLEAVERQITEAAQAAAAIERQRLVERGETLEKEKSDSIRRVTLELLSVVMIHMLDDKDAKSDEIVSDIVAVRLSATLMAVHISPESTYTLKWLEMLPSRYAKVRWQMANHVSVAHEWHIRVLSDAETFLRAYLVNPSEEMALFSVMNNAKFDRAFEAGREPDANDYATAEQVQMTMRMGERPVRDE
jgi:hypothetical protein